MQQVQRYQLGPGCASEKVPPLQRGDGREIRNTDNGESISMQLRSIQTSNFFFGDGRGWGIFRKKKQCRIFQVGHT